MMMSPEQFIEAQKAQLTAFVGMSQKSFANVEKVVELNMNAAKSYLDDSAQAVQTLLSVKDVQELMAVSSSLGQPLAEKAVSYGKDVYELASGFASESTKLVEEKLAESNKSFVELFETASKNAPAGSEGVVALVKSAMTAANSAYDSMSKAAKQAVEMAESNVANVTSTAVKSTKVAAAKKAA